MKPEKKSTKRASDRRWQICRSMAWKWLTKNRPDVALDIKRRVEEDERYAKKYKAKGWRRWQEQVDA